MDYSQDQYHGVHGAAANVDRVFMRRLCAGGCGDKISYNPARGSLEQPTCRSCRRRARERICERCGEKFDRYLNKNYPDQFCSRKCFVDSIRIWENPRAASKASSRARKLRHAETWDGVEDEQIFDRDDWACLIPGCERGPVWADLTHPHPLSPSIDHIIPLSRGGTDTAPNKRTAHFTCNVRRGTQVHPDDAQIVTPDLAPLGLLPARKPRKPREACIMCGTEPVRRAGDTCRDCRKAASAELQQRVLECRERGMTWKDTAVACGLSGPGAAHNVAYPPRDRYKTPVQDRRAIQQEPEPTFWWTTVRAVRNP